MLILGDFSSQVDRSIWSGVLGLCGIGNYKKDAQLIPKACSVNSLTITNTALAEDKI